MVRRSEKFGGYVYKKNRPSYAKNERTGSADAFPAIVYKKVSDSRQAISTQGRPLSGASGGAGLTPQMPGLNVYPLFLEGSSELYYDAAIETLIWAHTQRSGSAVSAVEIKAFDGTFPRTIHTINSTSTMQFWPQVLVYNTFFRQLMMVGNNVINGAAIAFRVEDTGLTDISTGLSAGNFIDGCYSRYDKSCWFIQSNGTVVKYNFNSGWSAPFSVSDTPVSIVPFRDYEQTALFIATTSSVYRIDLPTNTITLDYSGGTIKDLVCTAFKPWIAELSGSGLTIKRRNAKSDDPIWTTDFTFSSVSDAQFGMQFKIPLPAIGPLGIPSSSQNPCGLFIALKDSSDSSIAAKVYRRMPSSVSSLVASDPANKWQSTGTIYNGRSAEASTGSAPYYHTTFPKRCFRSLRRNMVLMLPFSNSSPISTPANGIDMWGMKERLVDLYQVNWYHENTFDFAIGDDTRNLLPTTVIRMD